MNKGRLLKMLALCVILLLMLSQLAYAAGPTAHAYGFTYLGDWSTDRTWVVDMRLDEGGYSSSYLHDNSASYVRYNMRNDAVFYICTHGSPGYFCCYSSSGTMTKISGNAVLSDSSCYSLYAMYNNTDYLKDMRLAYLSACHQWEIDPTYGCTETRLRQYGVDVIVSWDGTIKIPQADVFDRSAFWYMMREGYTVGTALAYAKAEVFYQFGDYGGVDHYHCSGNGDEVTTNPSNVRMIPARYGKY